MKVLHGRYYGVQGHVPRLPPNPKTVDTFTFTPPRLLPCASLSLSPCRLSSFSLLPLSRSISSSTSMSANRLLWSPQSAPSMGPIGHIICSCSGLCVLRRAKACGALQLQWFGSRGACGCVGGGGRGERWPERNYPWLIPVSHARFRNIPSRGPLAPLVLAALHSRRLALSLLASARVSCLTTACPF